MISDKQRREVATRLRSMKPEETTAPFGKPVLMHIFRSVFPDKMFLTNWILRLPYQLADLIEPEERTCKNVSGYQDVFECSECHLNVEITSECGNGHGKTFHVPYVPAYCPCCRAKVVG